MTRLSNSAAAKFEEIEGPEAGGEAKREPE